MNPCKREAKDTKGIFKLISQKQNDKAKIKRQTTVYKTQHGKLTTKQHKPFQKSGMILVALEGKADPALPVVSLMLVQTR